LFAVAATFLGGCAASNHEGKARHADVAGMMCPKCETVWTGPRLTGQGTKMEAYHWGREAVCPDCNAMAESYFKGGEKMLHDCPTCKVTPRPATRLDPSKKMGTHI
jgi:hypothetical protein